MGSSDKLGVEYDFGVEDLGDWAVLFRVFGNLGEFGLFEVRHVCTQSKGRAADAKSLAFRFESDGRFGAELGGSVAGGLQPKGERHGETTGMRGGNKLFGVGAFLVLEAGLERIGGFGEHALIGGKVAAAGAARAAPNRLCFADHGSLLVLIGPRWLLQLCRSRGSSTRLCKCKRPGASVRSIISPPPEVSHRVVLRCRLPRAHDVDRQGSAHRRSRESPTIKTANWAASIGSFVFPL